MNFIGPVQMWVENLFRFLLPALIALALYVMMDDSGLLCDAYNTTELGEKDCTRIYIMEKNRFSGWLLQRENAVKTISDF